MEEDIKSTLYQLLAKTRNLQPKYKFTAINQATANFQCSCECTVFGFNFVANSGPVKSKKEAQTQAAEIFCRYLVEQGHYSAKHFPQLFPTTIENNAPAKQTNDDLKCVLYAELGRRKMSLPEYKYFPKNDGRQYFECNCTVAGIDFVAHSGRAQTKKAVQNEAAEKMARWLVDNGFLSSDCFPQLQPQKEESKTEKGNWAVEELNCMFRILLAYYPNFDTHSTGITILSLPN